jgi:aspartate/glutamate racemase
VTMKRMGLIGGMSWESTALYYRLLNQGVAERLGGLHSADLLLASVDFAQIARLQAEDRWDDAGDILAEHGRTLEAAGAADMLATRVATVVGCVGAHTLTPVPRGASWSRIRFPRPEKVRFTGG